MHKTEPIELDEKAIDELNDETTWERRKFMEILNDPSERLDPVERINREDARKKALKKKQDEDLKRSYDMQWVRLQIFYAHDIQRENLAGERISILTEPDYFPDKLDELKKQLKQVTIWAPFRVTLGKDEIAIRLGSLLRGYEENYIDYFVQLNKNPPKVKQDLSFRADWGQWHEIGNYRKTRACTK